MDPKTLELITLKLTDAGLKLGAALALWLLGRWLIRFGVRSMAYGMEQRKVDNTIIGYARNTVTVLANIALVIALLGFFGIETTSFAAFIAGAGVAIGAAWSGLLSNFAAGAFMVILRPFKAGDFISAGGMTGTVEEIGLFVTTLNTPDNVRTFVGNSKIFSDTVQNFSSNAFRRVELTAPVAHKLDLQAVMAQLAERVAAIPNVIPKPAPEIKILHYSATGVVLAVRPHCHNDHYWQVYFDTNEVIKKTLGSGGYPDPETVVEINAS
jgi:small conductance mechanosensitive channel